MLTSTVHASDLLDVEHCWDPQKISNVHNEKRVRTTIDDNLIGSFEPLERFSIFSFMAKGVFILKSARTNMHLQKETHLLLVDYQYSLFHITSTCGDEISPDSIIWLDRLAGSFSNVSFFRCYQCTSSLLNTVPLSNENVF